MPHAPSRLDCSNALPPVPGVARRRAKEWLRAKAGPAPYGRPARRGVLERHTAVCLRAVYTRRIYVARRAAPRLHVRRLPRPVPTAAYEASGAAGRPELLGILVHRMPE